MARDSMVLPDVNAITAGSGYQVPVSEFKAGSTEDFGGTARAKVLAGRMRLAVRNGSVISEALVGANMVGGLGPGAASACFVLSKSVDGVIMASAEVSASKGSHPNIGEHRE